MRVPIHLFIAVAITLLSAGRSSAQCGAAGECFCDPQHMVGIAQLIRGVSIALGESDCPGEPNTPEPTAPAPTATPHGSTATPTIAVQITDVDLATNDLVYDRFTDTLYASVPSRAGAMGNSITAINPHTGAIGPSVFVGSEPGVLAISDDGQFLYVALNGAASVRRFNIATMTAEIEFPLGTTQFFGPRSAGQIEVLPGNPHAIAVSLRYAGVSPSFAGVAIFDDGVKRAAETPDHTGADVIAFSDSSSTLYGQDTEDTGANFFVMSVDDTGVSVVYDSGSYGGPFAEFGSDIEFDDGVVYASSGQAYDPVAMRLVGRFGASGLVAPDSTVGRIFFLTGGFPFNVATVAAFDQQTFLPIGSFEVPGASGNHHSFIRWGDGGLAFAQNPDFSASGADQVFLIETPLVGRSSTP